MQADHYTNFFGSIQVHKHYFVHIWYELTKSTSKTGFPVNRSRRFIAVTVLHLSLLSQRRLQLNHTENYFPVKTTSHNLHSIFSALMLIATWCPCDFAHHSNEHVYLQLDAYGVAGLSSNNNTSVQSIPIKSILQLNVPTYERYVQWSHGSSHFYLRIYSCTNRHFTTNFYFSGLQLKIRRPPAGVSAGPAGCRLRLGHWAIKQLRGLGSLIVTPASKK